MTGSLAHHRDDGDAAGFRAGRHQAVRALLGTVDGPAGAQRRTAFGRLVRTARADTGRVR